jgi:hypothetical protein
MSCSTDELQAMTGRKFTSNGQVSISLVQLSKLDQLVADADRLPRLVGDVC